MTDLSFGIRFGHNVIVRYTSTDTAEMPSSNVTNDAQSNPTVSPLTLLDPDVGAAPDAEGTHPASGPVGTLL